MSSNHGGFIRFLVWFGAVGVLVWLLSPLWDAPESICPAPQDAPQVKPTDARKPVWLHVDAKPTAAWRTKLSSLEDMLLNLVKHRPAEPTAAAEKAATAAFDMPDLSGMSPLLSYAPPEFWLGDATLPDLNPLDLAMLLGDDRDGFMRALASYKAGDFPAGDFAAASIKAALPVTAAHRRGLG